MVHVEANFDNHQVTNNTYMYYMHMFSCALEGTGYHRPLPFAFRQQEKVTFFI